jgi:fermentation-respiration switch protein FrsA (DUF1100 family)
MTSEYFPILSWAIFGSQVLGGILFTGAVILYASQDNLLYLPNPPGFPKTPSDNPRGFNSPGDWAKSGRNTDNVDEAIPFEEHFVETEDGIAIHTWLMLQPNSNDVPTLIYFHGNAGNMGFRLKNAAEMYARAKINVLMMDYRGYGASGGNPTEKGLNLDADAVLQFAVKHPRLQRSKMVAFGRSLGGAVSFALAHRHPSLVRGVVVENTFLSVGAMVDILMPFLTPIKWLVLKIKWNSDDLIQSLSQPIMFISGSKDTLVPPFHMLGLYKKATSRVTCKEADSVLYQVVDGDHNNTWEVAGMEYYRRLKVFMDSLNKEEGGSVDTQDSVATASLASSSTATTAETLPVVGKSSSSVISEDQEDYCFVKEGDVAEDSTSTSGGIPTMGKDFNVK